METQELRMKPEVLTSNGKLFNFLQPKTNEYDIKVIAWALSNICRFTGHTDRFYSVAQHSVHCSRMIPKQFALAALLHDAAEAFLGDVSAPLKQLLPDYQRIEENVERALFAAFGVPYPLPVEVKQVDAMMLQVEFENFFPATTDEEPASILIAPLTPEHAYQEFMHRFNQLTLNQ